MPTLMKCGHSTHATTKVDGENVPVCVACFGDPKALQVEDNLPDLTGRRARCSYYGKTVRNQSSIVRTESFVCKSEIDSNTNSAFFSYQPDKPFDQFYCGCWGWD